MTDEDVVKLRGRVQAYLLDALSPLMSGPPGVVALDLTVLVALDNDNATPMRLVLGMSPASTRSVMRASAHMAEDGITFDGFEQMVIPLPVKN